MGLASAYGMRTGGMGGSKKAKMLRTYYVHSPLARVAGVGQESRVGQVGRNGQDFFHLSRRYYRIGL